MNGDWHQKRPLETIPRGRFRRIGRSISLFITLKDGRITHQKEVRLYHTFHQHRMRDYEFQLDDQV
jgi:hypothetical protein